MKLSCVIRSVSDYLPVELEDCRATVIGRSVQTRIKSSSVSRNQLEIIPNFEKRIATVKQVGPNDSAVNGEVIGQGLYVVAKEGDLINIHAGVDEFDYRLCFEEKLGDPEGKKSTRSSDDADNNPKPVKIPKMFQPKSMLSEFRKDNSEPKGSWESIESDKVLVYVSAKSVKDPKSLIFAFDLDGTIISTKSGRVFPKDNNDWKFLYDSSITKLRHINEDPNSKILIITNQAGIERGKTNSSGFKTKIEAIARQISIPLIAFVLTGKNEYRKPLPTVWNLFVRSYNGGVTPDMSSSLYCGDAAGRKKDHSKVDRLFAANIGIRFLTPEEFFQGRKPEPFTMPLFDPVRLVESSVTNDHITFPHKQEVIIMVGFPGSGKSHFVKTVLTPKSYVQINRDTLKTAAKCKSSTENALENGMSVAIDNTNPTAKDREEYVKLAQKHGVPCRCFVMNVDHLQALHNNKFRELSGKEHSKVPEVAFNAYKSKFEEPLKTEGFDEIVKVNFVPRFYNDEQKKLYCLYLLEK